MLHRKSVTETKMQKQIKKNNAPFIYGNKNATTAENVLPFI